MGSTAVAAGVPALSPSGTATSSSSNTTATAAPAASSAGPAVGSKRAAPRAAAKEGHGDAKRRRHDFDVGDRGVFFTTVTPGASGNARRDLVRLLESSLPSVSSRSGGEREAKTAAAGLEAELKQLKESTAPFVNCGNEVAKGTGFVKFAGEATECLPSEVVSNMLETQRAEFQAKHVAPSSRLLCRVLPIDHTCKPFVDDFRKLAQAVLPTHVGPEAEPTVWALEFRARNTSTLKKEAVLSIVDEIVPKGVHKVSLDDPKKCILVEVNPLFCGLSVLPKWKEFRKYNLHALTSPPEAPKKQALGKAPPAGTRPPAPRAAEPAEPSSSSVSRAAAAPVRAASSTERPPVAQASPDERLQDGQAALSGLPCTSASADSPASATVAESASAGAAAVAPAAVAAGAANQAATAPPFAPAMAPPSAMAAATG